MPCPSQSSTAIYRLDLATGRSYRITSAVPTQPTSIAHDFTNNLLYLTTYTGPSVLVPGIIRLVSYNLNTGMAAAIGDLSAGVWAYLPVTMPQAIANAA